MYRIEVSLKRGQPDARGAGLVKDIHDLGILTVTSVRVVDIYWFEGSLSAGDLDLIGSRLLSDPITQQYKTFSAQTDAGTLPVNSRQVEVAFNAGVTDPVEDTIANAVRELGIFGATAVRTAKRYIIDGRLSGDQLDTICSRLLVNPIIQHVVTGEHFSFPQNPQYRFRLNEVELPKKGDGRNIGIRKQFGFSVDEFQAIIKYFSGMGRNPTDAELETLAQTWSEHCVHKTFRGKIFYRGQTIDNLLKSTIIKATRQLDKPWCLSVFEDNAGVIDFDEKWALCFKVETHNHPSAVEPYGGASTGVGGVVRDPLGTGLGAKPILNTDVFCFAPPDFPHEKLPKGVLHPRRIFKGVRAGVADYGNRLGIPTLNGAILFDNGYLGNPLVYCGTVGLMPKSLSRPGKQIPGDLVVVVGGKTGRDGIHGVTFASEKLTGESRSVSFSSVQIGNAIVEKKMIDVILQARDRGLYRRITDCGGGGLSSAVGEMAEETGVRVDLDKVPLKYAGLSYSEIWISESQERMLLAVPPEHIKDLLALFDSEDVIASVIGEFTDDRRLRLYYQGNLVCDLTMEFLHKGRPELISEAVWAPPQHPEPDFAPPADSTGDLLAVLGSWNVCSKEWVVRQYDHEVQGGSVLKPLVGKNNDGPGDAAVVRPVIGSSKGVIVANGINPEYGKIDPYWMAASAIDEALRQVIAVGGDLNEVALLDNFCWGNTNRPEILGALVRAAQACHDMSIAYETPFISGKDSLHNEFEFEGKTVSIPHTLLISAMGVMDNTDSAISMDFKTAGNSIYLVGVTHAELGGSAYFKAHGFIGNSVPQVDPRAARTLMDRLSSAIGQGLVRACHDCSEGGLGVALAEMAFAGGLGAEIDLSSVPLHKPIRRNDFVLFSESNSRFIVEVFGRNRTLFEQAMKGVVFARIGKVTRTPRLEILGLDGAKCISAGIYELKEAWQKPLRW
ncbi:MAG: phosphoribosylformylglycinamidine synthase subunit PurL [Dehalococcoidales bacterium]|nr:phosphoribosylformylglycinamidine synthase subunit PurL [Dehalococcoidales bacterium]